VVGLDVVSLDTAYATLHGKLVKGYAIEAMLEKKKKDTYSVSEAMARSFLDGAAQSTGSIFGTSVRSYAPLRPGAWSFSK
jgi:hypothetical protein